MIMIVMNLSLTLMTPTKVPIVDVLSSRLHDHLPFLANVVNEILVSQVKLKDKVPIIAYFI